MNDSYYNRRGNTKLCTLEDFERVGLKVPKSEQDSYSQRLCPDADFMKHLQIKNGYSNTEDREAFVLKILKCNNDNRIG